MAQTRRWGTHCDEVGDESITWPSALGANLVQKTAHDSQNDDGEYHAPNEHTASDDSPSIVLSATYDIAASTTKGIVICLPVLCCSVARTKHSESLIRHVDFSS